MIRLQPDIIVARLSTTMSASESERISESGNVITTCSNTQVVQTSRSDLNNQVTQHYITGLRLPPDLDTYLDHLSIIDEIAQNFPARHNESLQGSSRMPAPSGP